MSILEVDFGSVLLISGAVTTCYCWSLVSLLASIVVQRHPIPVGLAENPCPVIELQYLLFINI